MIFPCKAGVTDRAGERFLPSMRPLVRLQIIFRFEHLATVATLEGGIKMLFPVLFKGTILISVNIVIAEITLQPWLVLLCPVDSHLIPFGKLEPAMGTGKGPFRVLFLHMRSEDTFTRTFHPALITVVIEG